MNFSVTEQGLILPDDRLVRCALGRGGIGIKRREGDGLTPIGEWPLRRVLYRPDRMSEPETDLPVQALKPEDGWCDDPTHPAYNQPVQRPFAASHETLWRADSLYDLIVVLGFNDNPVRLGAGSALFLHVANPDYSPTEGCVALAPSDLQNVLQTCQPGGVLAISSNN